jgi:hypothetical protein
MTSRRIYHVNTGCDGGDEHIGSGIRCEFRKMMSANKGLILCLLVSVSCHLMKCGHWPEQDLVMNKICICIYFAFC